ncbi:MAG: F0F1 ATP synthase subunit B [Candidatus Nanopelagicales bacterium]|nr:F0F1 ATP synthase subunit B [Candidatus Nanopelagicales bacterium]
MGVAVISGATVLATEAEAGTTNFLVPNGTFFFILVIFLIVFGVIAKFVVQPVQKVLDERDRLVAQTAFDNRRAAEQDAAAESEFKQELTSARSEAGGLRDQARSEGRQVADDLRAGANDKVAEKLRQASEVLKVEGDALAPSLDASVDNLSVALANRILGVDGRG